ncbi:MAG: hypothetical protein IPM06_18735 [Rhizobiales bacterium]|nr:hypothetical protein [Hyphomicrobiales bacterium]
MPDFMKFMSNGGVIRIQDVGYAKQSTVVFNNADYPPGTTPYLVVNNDDLLKASIESLYRSFSIGVAHDL